MKIRSTTMKNLRYRVLAVLSSLFCFIGVASAQDWAFSASAASSQAWPAANVIDSNVYSQWSSSAHGSPTATEWISASYSTAKQVNYVKIYPRFLSGTAYGFPENFSVYWFNGASWTLIRSFTGYPNPYREDYIIVPLPAAVNATAIKVEATKLRNDPYGSYYFQLGEVIGGYDALYSKLQYIGNNGNANEIEIKNLGSDAFNPSKMKVWNYDRRNPIIPANLTACPGSPSERRNIYGANAVYTGGNSWKIFFGGYDGLCTNQPIDEVSYATTSDKFTSFSTHTKAIYQGDTQNVGNPSIFKTSSGSWRMVYTTYHPISSDACLGLNYKNKPGYSVSSDGVNWVPSAASLSNMLTMASYPPYSPTCDWGSPTTGQDVNGTNVIYEENGTWYFYWKGFDGKVQVSTSTNGVNFTHQGLIINGLGTQGGRPQSPGSQNQYGVNDVKKINGKYVWAYHYNGDKIWYSVANSPMPAAIADATVLFDSNTTDPKWSVDPYIVSAGWVTDGTRLHGVLYGASNTAGLDKNAVYARWLQKGAKLANQYTTLQWMKANGPDSGVILMVPGNPVETGNVTVYDTDGTTVLYTSPRVTMRQGDIWNYVP